MVYKAYKYGQKAEVYKDSKAYEELFQKTQRIAALIT
jgi:hypothetical protein